MNMNIPKLSLNSKLDSKLLYLKFGYFHIIKQIFFLKSVIFYCVMVVQIENLHNI